MKQEQIDRINALAQKARSPEGLSPQEQEEQKALRLAYVTAFREELRAQLDSIRIEQADGSLRPLKKREAPEKTLH